MTEKDASSGQDGVELSVSADGAKLAATGGGAGRLSNAVADALSPFSELAGALGDTIRAYRVENVIRASAKAREVAAKHNVQLGPVAPKFLVQWAEGASLEEPGPDDLSDLWANLLVSAVPGVTPSHLIFKRILTEMTGRHLELLKWVCDFDVSSQSFDFSAMMENAKPWKDFFGEDGRKEHRLDDAEDTSLITLAEDVNSVGVRMISVKHGPSGSPIWHITAVTGIRTHNHAKAFVQDHSADYLKLTGLIEEIEGLCRIILPPGSVRYAMIIKAWHITPLGIEFLRACTNAGAKQP